MLDLLRTRRSIRAFSGAPLEPALLADLRETALRAPTARNTRATAFVFVTDPAVLVELSHCKPAGAGFIAGAALGVVVCSDESRTDCGVEDASIAATHLQVAAHAWGLGSAWCQVRGRKCDDERTAEAFVRERLGIPSRYRVVCIVGLGYPAESKAPWPAEGLEHGRIHGERWTSEGV